MNADNRCHSKTCTMLPDDLSGDENASMCPEYWSTKHIMYLLTDNVLGYGPHTSIDTLEKGNGGIGVSDEIGALIAPINFYFDR